MADITVTIEVSDVEYTSWLRTSYIGLSKISDAGVPMVDKIELGPDQNDAFDEFLKEASREVLKLFSSRQGDVSGEPFEQDGTEIVYRFNEGEPILPQRNALVIQLNEDIKNAIYSNMSVLWFNTKDMEPVVTYYLAKFEKLSKDIEKNLYLLHD